MVTIAGSVRDSLHAAHTCAPRAHDDLSSGPHSEEPRRWRNTPARASPSRRHRPTSWR
ncbi:hypothetical protein SAM23877_2226 [Streptomyces ambofaciens ATCC 23877]|uniref:Uncharacterized protein n=1 Tax=Streptomyces ambofaciens (strain ATCC 23877 / 3486 / DSM 40053 / JCM 4204 / NBRC 12836 / NRRL B-2516) TaxID=278992 RepID=A0A0K2AQ82_STRA7|nr:hypothetical protein SAM23877_2226 [Streptomyces ambofaciens ATCC 23877]